MKRLMAACLAASALAFTACNEEEPIVQQPPAETPGETVEVTQNITQDTTWQAKNTYVLKKHVFVEAGTLTIEPGTVVKGEGLSSLAITTGGRISAVGTAEKPIVFTSNAAVGTRKAGDWGGVVLLGLAPINVVGGTNKIEGYPDTQPGIRYGGTNAGHDCGTLKYVRIEFAGYKIADGNELNGLTTGGCGSATQLDFIQVHLGADDGIEMFGGNANLKHAVITQPDDDGFDIDQGYTGKVQFMVIQQNAAVGNWGFEFDNNSKNVDGEPRTNALVYNVTMTGSGRATQPSTTKQGVAHLKVGTASRIHNLLAMNFSEAGVDVDGPSTVAQWEAGNLAIRNSIFWNIKGSNTALPDQTNTGTTFTESTQLMVSALGNRFADPGMAGALSLSAPSFAVSASSAMYQGGATPPSDGFFDTSATFIGGVGTQDWTAGWTAYPAN